MIHAPTPRAAATLLTVAVAVAGCGARGRTPEPELVTRTSYQPFGAAYRGVSTAHTIQHFDEHATETEFGLEFFMSADVMPMDSQLEVTFVVDSVVLIPGASGGASAAQVDSARQATFRGIMTRNGRVTEFAGGEESGGIARELADRALKQFFPLLPDHGVETGAEWSDTLETRVVVNGLDTSIRLISQHSALQWTQLTGERALHILTVSAYEFAGAGTQSGRAFTIAGSGRRHIHRYVSDGGRYLGLASADTSAGEARLLDINLVIPIQQTRIDSISIR